MALAPLRPCRHHGCHELVRDGYCEEHRAEKWVKRAGAPRHGSTRAWRELRQKKLQASPLCELCGRIGRTTIAVEVHHTERVADTGQVIVPIDDLMSVCRPCHNGM